MARKTIVQLIDDIDETVIGDGEGESVEFSLNGATFKLDLTNEHVEELHEQLAYWIEHAERVSGPGKRKTRGPGKKAAATDTPQVSPGAVRTWAADNDIELSSRGRIPAAVVEQYLAAR
ncbi:Lsr2 family protein [Rhodococcus sp. IEGM 1374]|uniref:histone-like nucleoid-structuring protein Lsr2 n=1 Tax=Rhodococcus sp. IEGM 1374 TaxID=3082221 RepID=UPI002955B6E0|nr:Lsr2 family protein [Rhodococcus sp. IEGM 1374]MDV7990490.1 Lsr2 family protein [Rhodococcus sp. IEGM 1374]